jgi:hypothetical protein
MRTRSFSFREIVSGFSNTSLDPLVDGKRKKRNPTSRLTQPQPRVCCAVRRPKDVYDTNSER